jgi:menaquinone-dependent protoporphyrinogen oxidase
MKKVLIVYETLHGSAEKCAMLLREQLNHETELIRLKENENIDLSGYDIIIVGGSIHMGVIHTRVRNFVQKNFDLLNCKPHGLYLCCMEQGDSAKVQFENAFPEKLRSSSIANGLFGGEFNFKKMSIFDRTFTKKVAKVNTSISRLDINEINNFVEKIDKVV